MFAAESHKMNAATRSLVFRQLFDRISCTYTYLLGCAETREAVIIDPVIELVNRDAKLVNELGLNLRYTAETHCHADHVTATAELRRRFPSLKSVISASSGVPADVRVRHGDQLSFGHKQLHVRATPGHTDGCVTYVSLEDEMAFTGDALFIRGCGRTDFQQGDAGKLYDCVHSQIFSLPAHFSIYPGHNYEGQMVSTVEEEMKLNPRLSKSRQEFIEIMNNLNLAYPKDIDRAVPANMVAGDVQKMDEKLRESVEATMPK